MVDWQSMFDLAVGVAGFMSAWIIKVLWQAVRDLQQDVKTLSEKLHNDVTLFNNNLTQNYVRRDDFKEAVSELKTMLEKIFDRLDTKVDKPKA